MNTLLQTAVNAARIGGDIIMRHYYNNNVKKLTHKKPSDYVTEVDRESQDAIVEYILKRFPHHAILAEEEGGGKEGEECRWIIDPLDGTTNFIHHFPVFAVSVAVERLDDSPRDVSSIEAGAVLNPVSGELFSAQSGGGAFLNGKSIKVSGRSKIEDCLIATGFPFRNKDYLEEFLTIFKRMFNAVSGIRRAGAAAIDLCWVASGALDGFWEQGLSPWDVAAGSLIVKEAGGTLSDFQGGSGYIWNREIIAAAPGIHQMMLNLICGR
ncbi:inositol monophosphatase [bacterium]|nr:inositol monophosphatase [FCB group bacterium]MBL7191355.1 inositol monophosphatase [bacterium]